MEGFKAFMKEYSGAVIGAIVAILILCTGLHRLILSIVVILMGIFLGNYVQRNKYDVKEKLKNFIDKM